jgi:hypothetical protein
MPVPDDAGGSGEAGGGGVGVEGKERAGQGAVRLMEGQMMSGEI